MMIYFISLLARDSNLSFSKISTVIEIQLIQSRPSGFADEHIRQGKHHKSDVYEEKMKDSLADIDHGESMGR